jgi:hypothetical protein
VRAAGNLQRVCRPGGLALVNMPFLIRIHDHPGDYWRFTPDGLRFLLTAVGLDVQWVRSWENRSCVRANFDVWRRYRPWHSLRNEDPLPLVVWRLPVDAVRDARVSFSGAELERVRIEYNSVRLHAAIGCVTPDDEHEDRGDAIRAARRGGLLVTDRRPWASHAPTKPGAPTTASTEPIARAQGRCGRR